MHRGNRFLVGVVMGGHSGGSRDAIMRNLLAENLDKAATRRTVAAITERNASDASTDVAQANADADQPAPTIQLASASTEPAAPPPARSVVPSPDRSSPPRPPPYRRPGPSRPR